MLLTIDIGTSHLKSALWNYDGKRLSFASCAIPAIVSGGQKHEADPSQWLLAFSQCCEKLGNLKQTEAIVISGNGPTLVPVLDGSSPNTSCINARLWLDRRAIQYQQQVSEVMNGFVDAGFFLPKILFIKNEECELYDRTKFFLGCPEYLAYVLTGQWRSVFPCEGFDRWFWNDAVLEKLALDKSKFPGFIRPGDSFGNLLPQAVMDFGFKKDIPVISGGPDFFAAILGAGITEPGQACDRTGSSEGINLCTKNRAEDSRLMSYGHPVKPWWNLSGIINTTGKAIDWGCGLLGLDNFDDFIALAKKSEPGSGDLVFFPYLAGERAPLWDPSARALWSGISLSAGRREFANSILEGIGYAIRNVFSVMEETGERAGQLHVTGGLAGCGYLNQIKADITGLEVLEGAYKEAELLGLAIIGSCSLGKFSCYKEASNVLCRTEKRYEPNEKNKTIYDRLFNRYKQESRNFFTANRTNGKEE